MDRKDILKILCAIAAIGLCVVVGSQYLASSDDTVKRMPTKIVGGEQAERLRPEATDKPQGSGVDIAVSPEVEPSADVKQVSVRGEVVLMPVSPGLVEHGPRESRLVSLTFDLCERDRDSAGFDENIVSILKEKNAKATFFMGGKWAETHPEAARMLGSEELFEVANHSYSHKVFTGISPDDMKSQVLKAQDSIRRYPGMTPRYFRYPAGEYNEMALQVVAECGLVPIQWDVVTGDPDPNVKAASMIRAVRAQARGGSIIIMHANGRGWHTAEALSTIIEGLRGDGYELATVSELLAQ